MRIAVIFTAHTLWRATLFPQRILLKIRADKQKKKNKKNKSPFFSLLSPSLSFCLSLVRGGSLPPCPPPPRRYATAPPKKKKKKKLNKMADFCLVPGVRFMSSHLVVWPHFEIWAFLRCRHGPVDMSLDPQPAGVWFKSTSQGSWLYPWARCFILIALSLREDANRQFSCCLLTSSLLP